MLATCCYFITSFYLACALYYFPTYPLHAGWTTQNETNNVRFFISVSREREATSDSRSMNAGCTAHKSECASRLHKHSSGGSSHQNYPLAHVDNMEVMLKVVQSHFCQIWKRCNIRKIQIPSLNRCMSPFRLRGDALAATFQRGRSTIRTKSLRA